MGQALLIIAQIVAWGFAVVLIGAVLEAAWARISRRRKQTLL